MRLQLQERVNELQEVRAARPPHHPLPTACCLPAAHLGWFLLTIGSPGG